jgi:cytochrome b6-f complex iron-sulfur subunit
MSSSTNDNSNRRGARRLFLARSAGAGMASVAALLCAGVARFLAPPPAIESSQRVRIGAAKSFGVGSRTSFQDAGFIVVSTDEGLYALSTICTHLGCAVRDYSTSLSCTCHGSVFDFAGRVKCGPAPRPLVWLRVGAFTQGELYVDIGATVRPGTYYKAV